MGYSPWGHDGDRYDLATKHVFENHVSTPTHPGRGPSLTMHPRNQGKDFSWENSSEDILGCETMTQSRFLGTSYSFKELFTS